MDHLVKLSFDCHLFSAVVTSNHICFVIGCRYQLKAASFSDTCSNHEGRLHGERQRRQHERRRERNRHRKRRGKLIVSLWWFKKSRKTTLFFEFVWFSFRTEQKMAKKHNSWPRYGLCFGVKLRVQFSTWPSFENHVFVFWTAPFSSNLFFLDNH